MAQLELVREYETLRLVKIAHGYHIVDYDEPKNRVTAAYSADKRSGRLLSAENFTDASIRSITRSRTQKTATAMYLQLVRLRKNVSSSFYSAQF